jgi:hypothetical protein
VEWVESWRAVKLAKREEIAEEFKELIIDDEKINEKENK